MYVSAKLAFNDKATDVNAIVYNIKSEFCEFYSSQEITEKITVLHAEENVLSQLEQGSIANFIASKNEIPYNVTIDWKENFLHINQIQSKK